MGVQWLTLRSGADAVHSRNEDARDNCGPFGAFMPPRPRPNKTRVQSTHTSGWFGRLNRRRAFARARVGVTLVAESGADTVPSRAAGEVGVDGDGLKSVGDEFFRVRSRAAVPCMAMGCCECVLILPPLKRCGGDPLRFGFDTGECVAGEAERGNGCVCRGEC